MAIDKTTAAEDLAFLKRLMSPDDDGAAQRGFGAMYALWGMAFAIPLFVQWAGFMGWVALPDWYWTVVATVVSVVLTILTIVLGRRDGPAVGVQAKAWSSVFAGVGIANLAVLIGLGLAANRLGDGRVLMLHAVVVFAFQGAAWYVVWALRRKAWLAVVSGGWFVLAAAMGATLPGPDFVLLAAVGLTLLMGVPGFVMMRTPRKT